MVQASERKYWSYKLEIKNMEKSQLVDITEAIESIRPTVKYHQTLADKMGFFLFLDKNNLLALHLTVFFNNIATLVKLDRSIYAKHKTECRNMTLNADTLFTKH